MNIQNADGKTDDRELAAGDVIFVPAHQEHRFHSVTKELVLLVVFAPAETSSERSHIGGVKW